MSDNLSYTSTATRVTVYLSGARVARSAKIKLAAGKTEAAIGGLSATLNPDSLSVEAKGAEIVNLKYAVSTIRTAENTARVSELVKLRDKARDAVAEGENTLTMLDARIGLLLQNCNYNAKKELDLDALKELDGYYGTTCEKLYKQRRECVKKLDENKREFARIEAELGSADAHNSPTGIVNLTLFAARAGEAELEITYYDERASWRPIYDLRVSDPDSPIALNARAKVYQTTGEDWDNVALTLSSAAPRAGMTPPELAVWYLRENIARPRPMARMKMNSMMLENAACDAMEAEACVTGAVPMMFHEASVSQAQTSVEFALPAKVSVPSDDDNISFDLVSHKLQAEYIYYCVPKLQPEVYLLAKVRGWEALGLLAGDASVFLSDSYLGSIYLDPKSDEDELSLSLGCDAAILVARKRLTIASAKGFLGATRKASRRWELSVKNTKPSEIKLKMLDQIPVSAYEPIKVSADELSGGVLNKDTGEITFELTLAAGETAKRIIEYSVVYPKDVPVNLE